MYRISHAGSQRQELAQTGPCKASLNLTQPMAHLDFEIRLQFIIAASRQDKVVLFPYIVAAYYRVNRMGGVSHK